MHPEWRLILDLDDQRAADDDGAGNHDDEDGRAVAGIDKGIIEPAGFTSRPQGQESRIQFALAAARTFAGDTADRALHQPWANSDLAWLVFRVYFARKRFDETKKGGPAAALL